MSLTEQELERTSSLSVLGSSSDEEGAESNESEGNDERSHC